MKYINLIIVLFFIHLSCFGQQRVVTGVIRDVGGETLPGATVQNLTTGDWQIADHNGEFSIRATTGDSIHFSFTGKAASVERVDARNVFQITLFDDEAQIEEVVITAFARQRRGEVVGSITSVNVRELRIPASNFTTALAGNVAGLISYQSSGEPGADNAEFFIRGVTTFGFARGPLILIDGFESTTDDLARLQVDDIESFSVMKDASAAVMYGARSANGIISIVTRTGREGPVRIGFRFDTNLSQPTRKLEFLDGVEYMRLYNEAQLTRNPLLGSFYSEQKIQMTMRGEHPLIYPNVHWFNEVFRNHTWNTRASLNVSGGGSVANYYVAGGFENETGLLRVDDTNPFNSNININRTHMRSNVQFRLSSTTTLDTRISGRFERYTGPWTSANEIFSAVMFSNPVDFPATYEPCPRFMDKNHTLFGSIPMGTGWKVNPYALMVMG
jgi:TonB-linked SusC/RagA family outer membrane protein